jgi:hypothetical protein
MGSSVSAANNRAHISARYSSGKTFLESQTVDLTLDSTDRTLAPPAEITGRLAIDGDAAAAVQHAVRLEPPNQYDDGGGDNGDAETTPGIADASGSFRIANVALPGSGRSDAGEWLHRVRPRGWHGSGGRHGGFFSRGKRLAA